MSHRPDPRNSPHPATAVTDYLESLVTQGDPRAGKVAELYRAVRTLVPSAAEGLSYGMPALKVHGKGLISILATAKHIGIYPMSGKTLDTVRETLRGADIPTTKGAIQLPNDASLPSGVLEHIVETRLQEIESASKR